MKQNKIFYESTLNIVKFQLLTINNCYIGISFKKDHNSWI